jgi:tripartite-type tricarboxylate transporter receptor subunit TctC
MKMLMGLLRSFPSTLFFAVLFGVSALLCSSVSASEPFYKDKTIRIIVGLSPGGFFDLRARHLARHMGRFIPGNPSMIVQNMPGGGGVVAANYLYGVAKPDGLAFGTIQGGHYLGQLVGMPGIKFDWPKFTFIGVANPTSQLVYARADLPVKSWRDLRKVKEPVFVGATTLAAVDSVILQVLRDDLGFNLRLIAGYPGGSDIDVAVERGELHARMMSVDPYMGREPFISWREKGFDQVLLQTGRERDPRLPKVATIWEIMDELRAPKETRELVETVLTGFDMHWIFIAPPGIPEDRVETLREAFMKALTHEKSVSEAVRMLGVPPNPRHGTEVAEMSRKVMQASPETVKRLKQLYGK